MPGSDRCLRRSALAGSLFLLVLSAPAGDAFSARNGGRKSQPTSHRKKDSWKYRRPTLRKVEVPPESPTRIAANKVLAPHWRQIRGIDIVIKELFAVNGKARVQFTGGTNYAAVGALEQGTELSFDDVDMRIYGVSSGHITRLVNKAFSEVVVSKHLEHGTPYSPAVLHLQFKVPRPSRNPMQLDKSLYNNEDEFDAGHQWVSTAKLKLEVPRGERPSRLFDRLTRLRRGETIPELRDPSGHGVNDAWDKVLRVTDERGMPPQRQLEGLLHTIYLAGKRPDWTVHPSTLARFTQMGPRKYREFFRGHGSDEQATIRARYLVNSFKPEPGRDVVRVLELGRETGLWIKLVPELRATISHAASWARLVELVDSTHRDAQLSGASRAFVFGALLAPVKSRETVEQFLNNTFQIENSDGETFRSDILVSYDAHRAEWLAGE